MPDRIAIPSAEFIRNIGRWQAEALRQPVIITHHGRARLVLAASDLLNGDNGAAPPSHHAELSSLRLLHHEMLAHIDEGFLELDAGGLVRNANNAAIAFLGCSVEDMRGRPVADAFSDVVALLITDRVQRVLRTRRAETFESSALDGRALAVKVLPAGEGVLVLFRNLTEQRLRQTLLEDCAALETAVSQTERAALVRLDLRGRIEAASGRFCAWSGFAAHDLTGHRLADLMPPAERRRFVAEFERTLRDLVATEMNLTFIARRGDELPVQLTLAPVQADYVARGVLLLLLRPPVAS
ncbi:MAG: PAS domain-containing protein [Hyphomonadaceae bacterium]